VGAVAVGDVILEWPLLVMAAVTTLGVGPALVRSSGRPWAVAFLAALALWLGLWTLPALWSGQKWLGGRWNWSGSLLALGGTLWLAAMLVRRGGLTWRDMGFTREQRPGSLFPALAVAAVALSIQGLLTIGRRDGPAPVALDTWLYQGTFPGLVEETIFRGVLLALLDRAFSGRAVLMSAPLGWGGVVVTIAFILLHPLTASSLWAIWPPAVLLLWLRARTGSLLLPVLVHNAWNLLAFVAGR
jgi:membrane protease YdiL (CAAX protease family)